MRSHGVVATLLAVGLAAAAAYTAEAQENGVSTASGPAAEARAESASIEGEAPPQECPAAAEAQEVEPENLDFLPEKIYLEEPFDCWYCQGCSSSINKACCFDGQGHYFCVAACWNGCNGPVLPEG